MKKVSLRELVADKIIFAVLIAVYYWTWARNDWKDYYTTIRLSSPHSPSTILSPGASGSKSISRRLPTKWPRPT